LILAQFKCILTTLHMLVYTMNYYLQSLIYKNCGVLVHKM